MEKAGGVPLFSIWGDLNGSERLAVIKQLIELEAQMATIRFPAFGALYHKDSLQQSDSCQNLESLIDSKNMFCVGPSCDRAWQNEMERHQPNGESSGPCKPPSPVAFFLSLTTALTGRKLSEYGLDLINREQQRVQREAITQKPGFPNMSIEEQVVTLRRAAKVMQLLDTVPQMRDFGLPLLWHTDLHMGNICISQEQSRNIDSIIDWQSLEIRPAFLQSRWPIFLEPPGNYILGFRQSPKPPDNFEDLDQLDKRIEKYKYAQANATKAYETGTFLWDRFAHDARSVSPLFKELFIRCDEAFDDGIIPLRECLIGFASAWNKLGFSGSPPFEFSQGEILSHRKIHDEYKEWHRIQ